MKNSPVSQLQEFLAKNDIANQKYELANNRLKIKTLAINNDLIVDYFIVFIASVCLSLPNAFNSDYAIFIIVPPICLWIDFQRVNNVIFDIDNQIVQIRSRNIFKRLIIGSRVYNFSDINNVYYKTRSGSGIFTRYVIRLSLTNNRNEILTDFGNKYQAEQISHFFNQIIHRRVNYADPR